MLSLSGCLLIASLMVGQAEEAKPALPKEAQDAMEFMTGQWHSEGEYDGKATESTSLRRWSACGTCITMELQTDDLTATGVAGWDPEKEEFIETWYNSLGEKVEIRT